jgi:protein O-mannosyl-transferase
MRPEAVFFRTPLFAVALMLLAVLVAYANALWGVFQFDDYNVIVNNSRVHSWHAWWLDLRHGIRPLLKFTYTLDWNLGLGAPGFHLANVLIHLANTLLVWRLSRHFVAQHPALQVQPAIPLFTALLFAVHPAHTEAVTYLCGRSSALMTLFYLAGLLFYIVGKAWRKRWHLHVLTPLCMLLALGVKETAVTFPFALLLWELYNGGSLKSALRQQWTSWLLLLVSAIYFLLHTAYVHMVENSAGLNSLGGNVATQAMAFVYLLRQWLFPVWLNIDPDLRLANDFSGVMPQMVALLLVIMVMLFTFRRRPWLSFALAWTVLQLFPLYIFLPRMDVANDRQLYLVSWPLALATVAEMSIWIAPGKFKWGAGLLIAALMSLTILRNQDYRSEVALWEATVQLSPDKARVQNNLGYAYMLAGRDEQARAAYTTALHLDSSYYQARYNLLRLDEKTAERNRGEHESAGVLSAEKMQKHN